MTTAAASQAKFVGEEGAESYLDTIRKEIDIHADARQTN
jgi:hypothetical protein